MQGVGAMSYCDECPFNDGVRGEEIICEMDKDPTDCPYKRREADE